MAVGKKKRRMMFRRKRSLDPNLAIDYKFPDTLKRFVTDRGKIIPRRISGATAKQQRNICKAVKRARFLGLIPYSVAHRSERGFASEMTAIAAAASRPPRPGGPRYDRGPDDGGSRDGGSRSPDDYQGRD